MTARDDFSPITSKLRLEIALDFIAFRAQELAKVVLGRGLGIDTLTAFTQSEQEYAALEPIIRAYGEESPFTHGMTLYVHPRALVVGGHSIQLLGVRRPDQWRPQVGYADYPLADEEYDAIKARVEPEGHVREVVSGRGQEMLELRHPDFNVLGYVIRARDHALEEGQA